MVIDIAAATDGDRVIALSGNPSATRRSAPAATSLDTSIVQFKCARNYNLLIGRADGGADQESNMASAGARAATSASE